MNKIKSLKNVSIIVTLWLAISQICSAQPLIISPDESYLINVNPGENPDALEFNVQNVGESEIELVFSVGSADSTLILYVDEPDLETYNGNIWTMRPDGSEKTQLTFDVLDREPVWSPDASRILFYSYRTGDGEIWVMNADGSELENLTNHPASDVQPHWSPDGQHILFSSDRDDSIREIYQMEANGSNVQRVTFNDVDDYRPRYAPDGQYFATQSRLPGEDRDIYIYTMDGNQYSNLGIFGNASDFQPSWLPFGNRVVWSTGEGDYLDIISRGFDGYDPFLELATAEQDFIPRFSPDGQFLAFSKSTFYETGGDEIFVWHKTLDQLNQITDNTPVTREWGPEWSTFLNPPQWISVMPEMAQLQPGENVTVSVSFDILQIPPDNLTSSILIKDFESNLLLTAVPVNIQFNMLPGDLNEDWYVDILDVIQVVNIILLVLEPSEQQFWAADLNSDSVINVMDVIILVNLIIGNN